MRLIPGRIIRPSIRQTTLVHSRSGDKPAYLGFGLGLRPTHYEAILNESPAVDWFEIISENYLVPGGKLLHDLDRLRARNPMVTPLTGH